MPFKFEVESQEIQAQLALLPNDIAAFNWLAYGLRLSLTQHAQILSLLETNHHNGLIYPELEASLHQSLVQIAAFTTRICEVVNVTRVLVIGVSKDNQDLRIDPLYIPPEAARGSFTYV